MIADAVTRSTDYERERTPELAREAETILRGVVPVPGPLGLHAEFMRAKALRMAGNAQEALECIDRIVDKDTLAEQEVGFTVDVLQYRLKHLQITHPEGDPARIEGARRRPR
jgi:hypothetical protein